MAWITGNGSSVGPGIMRTGRVWHWAQLIVTSEAPFVAGTVRPAHTEGGLRWTRPGSARPISKLVVKSALLSGLSTRARSVRCHAGRLRPSILPARCLVPGSTSPSTRAILACGSRRDALGIAQDEVEVAGVDEEAGALTQDEDGITAPQGVEEQGQAAADREIPEGAGH